MNLIGREIRGIRLNRLIGSGGMGRVYSGRVVRARPRLPAGTDVAVKVLHPHLASDPAFRTRFKREAGLGLTLRHPGIIKIYHVGSERVGAETVFFLVMEYMRGVTLRSVIRESSVLGDDMLRRIAMQLARALAVIHERGIIHRDIKPDNIFIEKGDVVKIGDFGLSQLGRMTRDSLHGGFAGSVAYAAPERFGPGRAKSPSDLYSLGVVLYELAVGSNPFAAGDLAKTIANHMSLVPPAPETTGALISPFMSHFIMALLEKDPEKRLGPPPRLIRILEKGEASKWWRNARPASLSGFISARRRHLKILRKTDFYGRSRELAELLSMLDGVRNGAGGRVAVLRGEAGVGKTRLIDRVLEEMDARDMEGDVAMVSGHDSGFHVPYFALVSAVLSLLDVRETDRHALRRRVGDKIRSLFNDRAQAESLTDLLVSVLPDGSAATMPPGASVRLFADFFTVLSRQRLLILVVEDVQLTGALTRGVLLEIARRSKDARILTVLTVRSGEQAERPAAGPAEQAPAVLPPVLTERESAPLDPMEAFLKAVERTAGARVFDLNRLDRADVTRILRDVGFPAHAVEGEVGARIYAATEGNPYFVLEVARLLLDEGVLNKENPDWFGLLRYIPTSIQEVFYRRIFKLSPDERRFLDCASVFGIRFRVEEVTAVLEMDMAAAARTVARLQKTFFLIRPTVGDRHRFDHVLIREMIHDNLDPEVRSSYHRRVGAYFEKLGQTRPLTGREQLRATIHYSLAGDHQAALRYFFQAFDYLLFKGAYETAFDLAGRAAAHVRAIRTMGLHFDPAVECRILLRQARTASHLGRRAAEFQALKEAAAAAGGDATLRPHVSLQLGWHYLATSRFISALHCVQAALAGMRRAGDRSGEAAALQTLADVMHNIDDQADTVGILEEALAIKKELQDQKGQARILTDMGVCLLERGAVQEAEKVFRESLSVFRTIRDDEGIAMILLGLGRLHRERGRLDLAATALRRAERIVQRLGQSSLKGRVLAELGECHRDRGDASASRRALERARRLAEDTNDTQLQVRVLAASARLRVWKGRSDLQRAEAVAEARRSVRLARQAQLPRRDFVNALNALAAVFLSRGKYASALAIARKASQMVPADRPHTLIEREAALLLETARSRRPIPAVGTAESAHE